MQYQCERCQEQSTDQILRTGKQGEYLCRDCYNQADDRDLGVIEEWSYLEETHMEAPAVLLETDGGVGHLIAVTDYKEAQSLGAGYVGHRLIDEGDNLRLDQPGPSTMERLRREIDA